MRTSLLALLGSIVYATARYHVFMGVSWSDWPIYTLNKALALSALFVLALSVIRQCSVTGHSDARALQMASVFGAMHVMLSLILLSPVYYEKLFVQGRLTAAAGLSMVLGAVAATAMAAGRELRGEQRRDGGIGSLATAALVVGLHAMLQGFRGWLSPSQWPGMMPPLTLIAFLLGLAAVAVAVCPKRAA